MNRRIAAALVALSIVLGGGAGYLVQRANDEPAGAAPPTTTSTPSGTTTPKPTTEPGSDVVEANRAERKGQPAWSPADPVGPDGEALELGLIVPGAAGVVRIGDPVDKYVRAGYIVEDLEREQICEGDHYKWAGGWSEGMDVIVDERKRVVDVGIRLGFETAEGIAVGNTYGALKRTYGTSLVDAGPNDYGQVRMALKGNGDGWVGFLFDASPDELTDASKIVFMAVARGDQAPGLLRDGC